VLVRAAGVALRLGRAGLRRARLRRALALCHVLMLAAHVLHFLPHLLLHLAVHLPVALALMALTLVLHPAVTLAVRPRGLRVLADGCAMVVTLSLCQRPSTGEHRGRRDAADQQNLRLHVCLQCLGNRESIARAHWSGRISPKFFRNGDFCDKVCQARRRQHIDIY
jgi:hypothetical protein